MQENKTILVAPLHWGLGHATRCIPIINALIENDYTPLLASDGAALELLRNEFPNLEFIELPSYQITYAKKASGFKWKLLFDSPKMLKAINEEKKIVKQLVSEGRIHGIISDNRLGVRNKRVPSAFITHQLNVLTGNTTWLSTKMHLDIIKKFDACWVPDIEGVGSLSGKLGHPEKLPENVKYIGPLSRMKKRQLDKKYDILVLLSGPEPQRTILEEKLMLELKNSEKKILFVLGKVEEKKHTYNEENFRVYNFMSSKALEKAINESEVVISRSGYTTIMDLAVLEKKAFFIPTPGQFEQEYLAKRLKTLGMVPSCKQDNFNIEKLDNIAVFKGLKSPGTNMDLKSIFSLFEGK
tara:strand:- start:118804 stop:119865 length:1062 start_codon:yes stop_codon:yes gene_type:complete